jgi:hypothetical protein
MATLPAHLSVGCEGELLRARRLPCFDLVVVRQNYEWHHREITTVADLKACLRAGKYAWPGGYACYFVTSDGEILSFEAVREELTQVMDAIKHNLRSGWKVVGMACTAEDDETARCCHTGKEIV